MNTVNVIEEKKIPYDQLYKMGISALKHVNVPFSQAKITVEVLLRADLRGVSTHGIKRLTMYIPRLKNKLINPQPKIKIKKITPAISLVHGNNGLGPVVASKGMDEAISIAKKSGVSFVCCRESNHFGAAAPYTLMACKKRMIGIAGTNAFPTMAPWGGVDQLVGNNPISFGVPFEKNSPFLLDMAMSVSSRGRLRMMAEKGQKIPEGWAIDEKGQPTTDPLEGLKGLVLPIGSFKGYGLAVAMDILSGVITGSAYSNDVKSLLQQWDEPQNIGHFFIVIDPKRFMKWSMFSERMSDLCNRLRTSKRIDPDIPVLIAGDLEDKLEKEYMHSGIPLNMNDYKKLNNLSKGQYDHEIEKF